MLDSARKSLHEANRRSWNAATVAHNSHKGNQIRFLQDGGSTLFAEERELLGDVRDKSLLHLQCNCGQDSLSLAALGAQVAGVDICDQAIDFARSLSIRTGIPAEFHRADLYDWLAEAADAGTTFDLVFSSYGAVCWLSDLELWAELIHNVLAKGGRFVLVDFHPVLHMFDEHGQLKYPYTTAGMALQDEHGVTDYVGESRDGLVPWGFQEGILNFKNPYPNHFFQWSVGEVVTAFLKVGMSIQALEEYPYANGCSFFQNGISTGQRRMLPPSHLPTMPMMYGLAAQKPVRNGG